MFFFSYHLFLFFFIQLKKYDLSDDSEVSLKDLVTVNARLHPSIAVRMVYRIGLFSLQSGNSLHDLLKKVGLIDQATTSCTFYDFKSLVKIITENHPVVYPVTSLVRLLTILSFIIIIQKTGALKEPDQLWSILLPSLSVIIFDHYQHVRLKKIQIQAYFFTHDPAKYLRWTKGQIIPTYGLLQQKQRLWSVVFELHQDLKKAAQLFNRVLIQHEKSRLSMIRYGMSITIDLTSLAILSLVTKSILSQQNSVMFG